MSRRSVKAGNAEVYVGLNKSGVDKGLRALEVRFRTAAKVFGSLGAKLTGFGGAVSGAFLPAISAASDFEETFSKFQTVFGDNAEIVKQWSDTFAAEIGRSKLQVADFMASSQDLFVPLGFDDAAATELSKTLTELAVDLASFNNMQDADVLRDLHAALTGSGEVMKKFGVIVSEAAVKQELLNQSLDPKFATETQKAQARLNIILAGTTSAQGDAIRTSASFANQMKRLKGSVSDVSVAIGQAVLPMVTTLVNRVNELSTSLSEWVAKNQETIAGVFASAVAAGALGTAFLGIALAADMSIKAIALLKMTAAAASAAFGILAAAGKIVSAVYGFMSVIVLAFSGNLAAQAAVTLAWVGIQTAATTAVSAAWTAMTAVVEVAQAVMTGGMSTLIKVGLTAAVVFTGLVAAFAATKVAAHEAGTAWGYIKGVLANLLDIAKTTFGGVKDALAAGDYVMAAKILWAALKVVFFEGVQGLIKLLLGLPGKLWDMTKRFTTQLVSTLANVFMSLPSMLAAALSGESIRDIVASVLSGGDLFAGQIADARLELAQLRKEAADTAAAMQGDSQPAGTNEADARIKQLSEAGMTEETKLRAGGASQQQIDQINKLKQQQEAAEASEKARDAAKQRVDQLKEEIRQMIMGADAAELYRLKQEGATTAELAAIKALQDRKRALDQQAEAEEEAKRRAEDAAAKAKQMAEDRKRDADQIRESLKSPLDKFKDEVKRIRSLVGGPGGLTRDQADAAIGKARADLLGKDTAEAIDNAPDLGVAQRGSKAALDAIARARGGDGASQMPPWVRQQTEIARQQVAAAVNMPSRLAEAINQRNEKAFDTKRLETLASSQLTALNAAADRLQEIADNTDPEAGEPI